MPSPFPGMDPYLENPQYWRPIHARLIGALDDAIREQLPSTLFTTIEERVYLSFAESAYPDILIVSAQNQPTNAISLQGTTLVADEPLTIAVVPEEIVETYLEIRLPGNPERVIAAIEVLSPKNKSRESRGRDAYIAKQNEILNSEAHLVEIDLLRDGAYSLSAPYEEVAVNHPMPWHYAICLHRALAGPVYNIWLGNIQSRLPIFKIPLTSEYPDIVIDLNRVVAQVYQEGRFENRINYRREPMPPLAPTDAQWADTLLRNAGLR